MISRIPFLQLVSLCFLLLNSLGAFALKWERPILHSIRTEIEVFFPNVSVEHPTRRILINPEQMFIGDNLLFTTKFSSSSLSASFGINKFVSKYLKFTSIGNFSLVPGVHLVDSSIVRSLLSYNNFGAFLYSNNTFSFKRFFEQSEVFRDETIMEAGVQCLSLFTIETTNFTALNGDSNFTVIVNCFKATEQDDLQFYGDRIFYTFEIIAGNSQIIFFNTKRLTARSNVSQDANPAFRMKFFDFSGIYQDLHKFVLLYGVAYDGSLLENEIEVYDIKDPLNPEFLFLVQKNNFSLFEIEKFSQLQFKIVQVQGVLGDLFIQIPGFMIRSRISYWDQSIRVLEYINMKNFTSKKVAVTQKSNITFLATIANKKNWIVWFNLDQKTPKHTSKDLWLGSGPKRDLAESLGKENSLKDEEDENQSKMSSKGSLGEPSQKERSLNGNLKERKGDGTVVSDENEDLVQFQGPSEIYSSLGQADPVPREAEKEATPIPASMEARSQIKAQSEANEPVFGVQRPVFFTIKDSFDGISISSDEHFSDRMILSLKRFKEIARYPLPFYSDLSFQGVFGHQENFGAMYGETEDEIEFLQFISIESPLLIGTFDVSAMGRFKIFTSQLHPLIVLIGAKGFGTLEVQKEPIIFFEVSYDPTAVQASNESSKDDTKYHHGLLDPFAEEKPLEKAIGPGANLLCNGKHVISDKKPLGIFAIEVEVFAAYGNKTANATGLIKIRFVDTEHNQNSDFVLTNQASPPFQNNSKIQILSKFGDLVHINFEGSSIFGNNVKLEFSSDVSRYFGDFSVRTNLNVGHIIMKNSNLTQQEIKFNHFMESPIDFMDKNQNLSEYLGFYYSTHMQIYKCNAVINSKDIECDLFFEDEGRKNLPTVPDHLIVFKSFFMFGFEQKDDPKKLGKNITFDYYQFRSNFTKLGTLSNMMSCEFHNEILEEKLVCIERSKNILFYSVEKDNITFYGLINSSTNYILDDYPLFTRSGAGENLLFVGTYKNLIVYELGQFNLGHVTIANIMRVSRATSSSSSSSDSALGSSTSTSDSALGSSTSTSDSKLGSSTSDSALGSSTSDSALGSSTSDSALGSSPSDSKLGSSLSDSSSSGCLKNKNYDVQIDYTFYLVPDRIIVIYPRKKTHRIKVFDIKAFLKGKKSFLFHLPIEGQIYTPLNIASTSNSFFYLAVIDPKQNFLVQRYKMSEFSPLTTVFDGFFKRIPVDGKSYKFSVIPKLGFDLIVVNDPASTTKGMYIDLFYAFSHYELQWVNLLNRSNGSLNANLLLKSGACTYNYSLEFEYIDFEAKTLNPSMNFSNINWPKDNSSQTSVNVTINSLKQFEGNILYYELNFSDDNSSTEANLSQIFSLTNSFRLGVSLSNEDFGGKLFNGFFYQASTQSYFILTDKTLIQLEPKSFTQKANVTLEYRDSITSDMDYKCGDVVGKFDAIQSNIFVVKCKMNVMTIFFVVLSNGLGLRVTLGWKVDFYVPKVTFQDKFLAYFIQDGFQDKQFGGEMISILYFGNHFLNPIWRNLTVLDFDDDGFSLDLVSISSLQITKGVFALFLLTPTKIQMVLIDRRNNSLSDSHDYHHDHEIYKFITFSLYPGRKDSIDLKPFADGLVFQDFNCFKNEGKQQLRCILTVANWHQYFLTFNYTTETIKFRKSHYFQSESGFRNNITAFTNNYFFSVLGNVNSQVEALFLYDLTINETDESMNPNIIGGIFLDWGGFDNIFLDPVKTNVFIFNQTRIQVVHVQEEPMLIWNKSVNFSKGIFQLNGVDIYKNKIPLNISIPQNGGHGRPPFSFWDGLLASLLMICIGACLLSIFYVVCYVNVYRKLNRNAQLDLGEDEAKMIGDETTLDRISRDSQDLREQMDHRSGFTIIREEDESHE